VIRPAERATDSLLLKAYLRLEALMIRLDARGFSAVAEDLRDGMEPLWYALSTADKEYLNSQTITLPPSEASKSLDEETRTIFIKFLDTQPKCFQKGCYRVATWKGSLGWPWCDEHESGDCTPSATAPLIRRVQAILRGGK
jgi:hypothetical protein